MDRCKQRAPAFNRIIPITVHIDIAAGSPDIVRRGPIPVRPAACPISRAPGITILLPNPVARSPPVIRRRRRDIRTGFHGCRWRCQIGRFPRRGVGPIAGRPLIALGGFQPIAGHPLAARRQGPPSAADPEEVARFLIPRPIARNPGDVVAFRALARRHFFDKRGRGGGDNDSRFGIVADHPGEGLVHRPAGEDLHASLSALDHRHRGLGGLSVARGQVPAGAKKRDQRQRLATAAHMAQRVIGFSYMRIRCFHSMTSCLVW